VLGDSRPLVPKTPPHSSNQREAGVGRKSHSFGVQQGDPLNGESVRFRFGLPEGWIVKLFGPSEVEVLRRN